MRQGGTARRTLTTRPLRATNATSIAKRMKNVWMALLGAMISALSSGMESCFRSPRRRDAESNAGVTVRATPVVAAVDERILRLAAFQERIQEGMFGRQ